MRHLFVWPYPSVVSTHTQIISSPAPLLIHQTRAAYIWYLPWNSDSIQSRRLIFSLAGIGISFSCTLVSFSSSSEVPSCFCAYVSPDMMHAVNGRSMTYLSNRSTKTILTGTRWVKIVKNTSTDLMISGNQFKMVVRSIWSSVTMNLLVLTLLCCLLCKIQRALKVTHLLNFVFWENLKPFWYKTWRAHL